MCNRWVVEVRHREREKDGEKQRYWLGVEGWAFGNDSWLFLTCEQIKSLNLTFCISEGKVLESQHVTWEHLTWKLLRLVNALLCSLLMLVPTGITFYWPATAKALVCLPPEFSRPWLQKTEQISIPLGWQRCWVPWIGEWVHWSFVADSQKEKYFWDYVTARKQKSRKLCCLLCVYAKLFLALKSWLGAPCIVLAYGPFCIGAKSGQHHLPQTIYRCQPSTQTQG